MDAQTSDALAPVREVLVESWTMYSIAIVLFSARLVSKWLQHQRFHVDDLAMAITVCPYTSLIVTSNIIASANTNELLPGQFETLSKEDIAARVYGSKIAFVQEESMIHTIWGVKVCLLILYYRMTKRMKLNLSVKLTAGYVGLGYILLQVLFLGVYCRPINQYWAVPPGNEQCASWSHHLITQAVLNLSSDVMIISIPIVLVAQATMNLHRKIELMGIFSLGVFVIVCAICNKYFNISDPASPQWLYWYVREGSCAMFVSNIILIRPLIAFARRRLQIGRDTQNKSHGGYYAQSERNITIRDSKSGVVSSDKELRGESAA